MVEQPESREMGGVKKGCGHYKMKCLPLPSELYFCIVNLMRDFNLVECFRNEGLYLLILEEKAFYSSTPHVRLMCDHYRDHPLSVVARTHTHTNLLYITVLSIVFCTIVVCEWLVSGGSSSCI